MPFLGGGTPYYIVPRVYESPAPLWPAGMWDPMIRPVTIGSPTSAIVVPQPQGIPRRFADTAAVRPETVQVPGVLRTRPESPERVRQRPESSVQWTRPASTARRAEDRTEDSRRKNKPGVHRSRSATIRTNKGWKTGVQGTRFQAEKTSLDGTVRKEVESGNLRTRVYSRSSDRRVARFKRESEGRRDHAPSSSPTKQETWKDLRGRVNRKRGREIEHRQSTRQEHPPQKKTKEAKCPVDGCLMDVGGRLIKHLESHHIPGLFHQGETTVELGNHQFQSQRRHALEMVANFLFGPGSKVSDLVEFVNMRMERQEVPISVGTEKAMDALAEMSDWPRPNRWSVSPLTSPAALIHWRPLSFLISQLQPQDRREVFLLFGERWTVTEVQPKKRKNRPNPANRRRYLLSRSGGDQAASRPSESRGPTQTKKDVPSERTLKASKKTSPGRPTTPRDQPTRETPLTERTVCLKDNGEKVSPHSMKSWTPTGRLSLTLEPESSPELKYSESPSPRKTSSLTAAEEEAILASDSPGVSESEPMEVGESPKGAEQSNKDGLEENATLDKVETSSAAGGSNPATCEPSTSFGTRSYAEVAASKRSPVALVKPRTAKEAKKVEDIQVAFDSHFHLDRLSRKLNKVHLEESTIFEKVGKPPTVPVTLSGGVMVFCDPTGYDHIPKGWDPKWKTAVGVHPKKIKDLTPKRWEQLQKLLKKHPVVGEVGLDYGEDRPEAQRDQLAALERILPLCQPKHVLVLHVRGRPNDPCSRDAFADCLAVMKKLVNPQQRIHLHCFAGDKHQVSSWTRAFSRCYFGFTGKVKRFNQEQKEALRLLPIQRLLIETDSPYFPVKAGQYINTPAYIGEVAEAVARVRVVPVSLVLEETTRNARHLYA